MPILGVIDSAKSGNLWAPTGAYDSLQSATLGATTAQITFANIPSTYSHLQIRYSAQTNRATYLVDDMSLRLNGNGGSNYWSFTQYSGGNTSNAVSTSEATTSLFVPFAFNSNATGAIWSMGWINLYDYSSATKVKSVTGYAGFDANGATAGGYGTTVLNYAGRWNSTNAVNSITIRAEGSFLAGTRFSLYGIKGA
jgi:hypothetical protein